MDGCRVRWNLAGVLSSLGARTANVAGAACEGCVSGDT
jgi:hypothetical protein